MKCAVSEHGGVVNEPIYFIEQVMLFRQQRLQIERCSDSGVFTEILDFCQYIDDRSDHLIVGYQTNHTVLCNQFALNEDRDHIQAILIIGRVIHVPVFIIPMQ